jgi:hypothetical protein
MNTDERTLSATRLELAEQGMLIYALKTAYRVGSNHIVFERAGLPSLDQNVRNIHGQAAMDKEEGAGRGATR